MGWTGGYVLLALLLAPYLRKFGKFTVPEFIGDRYYSQTARVVAVICLIFISFTYVAGQMRGVGIVFSRFLEVDIVTGLIVGMAHRVLLRRARRHEGHHLHPGGAVLRADLRLHGAGDLHLPA
jgi:Na+(H+)/acetate symporter ActP